jgi:hypothetical protein
LNRNDVVKIVVKRHPEIIPYLHKAIRFIAAVSNPATKTEGAYFMQIWKRVKELYNGEISEGDFADAMARIVQEQLTKAFRAALRDSELDPNLVNEAGEGFADELEQMILDEYDFVDGLASDIVSAAGSDSGYESFRSRAEIWANRYNDAYNTAMMIIGEQYNNNMIWEYGDTEHCDTCQRLNGIVMSAREWDELGVRPQDPPNDLLECGGWRCGCTLSPTDKRRSPKAYDTVLNIVSK